MILKIATITFNHAHNHGSMLQTYALQQFVYGLGNKAGAVIDYRVIDYHTDNQRAIYAVSKRIFHQIINEEPDCCTAYFHSQKKA